MSHPVSGQGRGLVQLHKKAEGDKNWWINHGYMASDKNGLGLNWEKRKFIVLRN